jgi:hypothetical protein
MLITKKKSQILPPKPTKSYFKWYLLGFVLLLAAIALFFSQTNFEKSVQKNKLGEITDISEKQKEKFRADSAKLNQCVQYALIANEDGWYEKCDKTGKFYLLKGEVWKYGVTCEGNPENRYENSFYDNNNLIFQVQFRGNHLACEIEEKRKLYFYPTMPENLRREAHQKLVLPIGNCKYQ